MKDPDDRWCHDTKKIKRIVVDHFKALFTAGFMHDLNINSLGGAFLSLTDDQKDHLTKEFTPEDICMALKNIRPFKAPGPDSFHAVFFQRFWHLVREEVSETVLKVMKGW